MDRDCENATMPTVIIKTSKNLNVCQHSSRFCTYKLYIENEKL